jgi:ATP-dependent phosphoenolpyruvate carboxykinase
VRKHNIIMSEANNITSLPPESKSTAKRALVFFYEGLTIGKETETTDEGYKPMNS